jgi:hypothetical protein
MDEAEAKRLARITLCGMAERARGKMSAVEWEDSVEDTPEGKLLGSKEIDAIGSLIFGRNTKRRR